MPPRCRQCDYDRTGLVLSARCPECGSRRAYFDGPTDWRRFGRWPGLLTPVGLALVGTSVPLHFVGAGMLIAIAVAVEGLLIALLGLIRWD